MNAHCLATLALAIPLRGGSAEVELEAAIARASARLVELQENLTDPEGQPMEWPYEGVYREAGHIPAGYRVGGTAIAAWALIEVPGYAEDQTRRAAVGRALDFVLTQLEEEPRLATGFRGTYDVRGWGHTYALELLLRLRAKQLVPRGRAVRVEAMIASLVERLEDAAIAETGGWNYARRGGGDDPRAGASPFMTAPTLMALVRARDAGVEVDAKILERAFASLREGLRGEGVSAYSSRGGSRDTVAGSVGRLPVSYLALGLADEDPGHEAELARSVEWFLEHWGELEKRRRQTGTHLPPHGIAPYYFFYAHLYVAFAIEELPAAQRRGYRTRFLARLFEVGEASGGWNDRVFERSESFGTAMSLLALLAPDLDRLPKSGG